MAFKDLDEFLAPEPLELPIHGKLYAFPGEISARTWLLVQRVGERAQGSAASDDDDALVGDTTQAELMKELLGDALQEMLDDGVTNTVLQKVLMTLMAYHMYNREAAEAVWNQRGNPKAPNRATRRKTPAKSTR